MVDQTAHQSAAQMVDKMVALMVEPRADGMVESWAGLKVHHSVQSKVDWKADRMAAQWD